MAPSHREPLQLVPGDPLATLDRTTLRRLYLAARRITAARSIADVRRALLDGACELLALDAAALYGPEHGDTAGGLVCLDLLGDWEPPARLDANSWPHQAQLVVAADHPLGAAFERPVALLDLPHSAEHGLLVVLLGDAQPSATGQVALLALVEDAATALARLHQQERAATGPDDPGLLAAVGAVSDLGLLHGSTLERLLDAMLAQILAVLPVGGGALYLFNEPSGTLKLATWAAGPQQGYTYSYAPLWGDPAQPEALALAQEAAQRGRSLIHSRETLPQSGQLATTLHALSAAALVGVPLLAGGWLIGVLQLVAAPNTFPQAPMIAAAEALARQAAATIESVRLYAHARADQERTRAVVDASNDAIVMIDEHRRPIIVNRRARFFFGLTERDLLGRSLDQIGGVFARIFEDGRRFDGWLAQLLRSPGERGLEEFRVLSPEPRLLQCYSAPVTDRYDRYLGRLLVFRDITREREVERMKNEFVSTVSHELRTPLTSIQGALQLVLGQPDGGHPGLAEGISPRARDLLTISRVNSERLIRLINDILDVAKIEQGRMQLRREPLDPAELCSLGAAEVGVFAASRGINVELQLRHDLPLVLADHDRTVQILVNLLSNAIKFSSAGQQVLLSARRDGAMIAFAVQDWGRGIAPEQQAQLFQKFQQIDSSPTRDVGGTGLGLAISKALVEEQGGRMWLESRPGAGSTFSFTLPVAPNDRELADDGSDGVRVLVVDDDPHVRPVLVRLLQRYGVAVRDAGDGYQALALADSWHPDVILLDIKMPGLDGFEVLRRLKDRPQTAAIPVVILTANDLSDPLRAHGLELGAHAFLEKPIAYERLISAVTSALSRSRGQP